MFYAESKARKDSFDKILAEKTEGAVIIPVVSMLVYDKDVGTAKHVIHDCVGIVTEVKETHFGIIVEGQIPPFNENTFLQCCKEPYVLKAGVKYTSDFEKMVK